MNQRTPTLLLCVALFVGLGTSCQRQPSPLRESPKTQAQQAPTDRAPTRRVAPAPATARSVVTKAPGQLTSVLIRGVPHVEQKPDFCGEACAEMYLKKLGYTIDQDQIFARCQVDPGLGRGCITRELASALQATGFATGPVWHKIEAAKSATQLQGQFAQMHADLAKGIPSIVCMHYDDSPQTTEHFRLVLGYDHKREEIIYHEPAVAKAAYQRMKRSLFLKLWPLKYKAKEWLAVRMRLQVTKIKKSAPTKGHTVAAFAQHVMKLKQKLPKGFTMVIEPPFVVVGDGRPAQVKQIAASTVRWSVTKLKQRYFKRDPLKIIDIWLFQNRASYQYHTKKIFGEKPGTPYGYYSGQHNALIMNIATGGGTLVHEIVHPYVEANFPGYRAWFNEGLGSLYEQSSERNGKIIGLTNWRLAGLQEAIKKSEVPSFKKLMSTTEQQFYNADPGTNYSQSRYLLYYLQEKGVLEKYYHAYFKNRRSDPTGYKTLKKVLGTKSVKAFQKKWERWVLKLRF